MTTIINKNGRPLFQSVALDANGVSLANHPVTVYLTGTETVATVYTSDGVNEETNLKTDQYGNISFRADSGTYDIAFADPNIPVITEVTEVDGDEKDHVEDDFELTAFPLIGQNHNWVYSIHPGFMGTLFLQTGSTTAREDFLQDTSTPAALIDSPSTARIVLIDPVDAIYVDTP